MNSKRYKDLMGLACSGGEYKLTPEEVKEGWHFCWSWDGILIHTSDEEYKCCECAK
jgi:hypothetical protein